MGGATMSDLKEIIGLLPKIRKGRELTINYDKAGWWYVGYPNLEWDFSIDLNATDKDVEGACLSLLSQIDKEQL
jgi:hypothetical protein